MNPRTAFEPLDFEPRDDDDMRRRARAFRETMATRRTVREFSTRPIPEGVLEACLQVAGSAPSGANLQPWHFAVVTDPSKKRAIRMAAEREERTFYHDRAPEAWLATLAPLGTGPDKPFLESAPALVVVFQRTVVTTREGREQRTYYPKESVGIATGFLIAALHHAGLATLTHTPSPMGFLNRILDRPPTDKPFVLLVVGFPAHECTVPRLHRRSLDEIASFDAHP